MSVPWEPVWRILNFLSGRYVTRWGNTPGHIQHFSASRLRRLLGRHIGITRFVVVTPWLMAVGEPLGR